MAEPVVPKRRRLGFSEIPRKVRWIIYANAAGGVGFGYLMIFITAYYPQIGVGPGTIGLILGSEGASMVVCAVPLGIYSDRRGRKSPLLVASAVLPPTILVFAFTTELRWLVLAAVVAGVAEGGFLATWNAIIADQTTTEQRNAAFELSFILGHVERPAPGALQHHGRPVRRGQGLPCEAIRACPRNRHGDRDVDRVPPEPRVPDEPSRRSGLLPGPCRPHEHVRANRGFVPHGHRLSGAEGPGERRELDHLAAPEQHHDGLRRPFDAGGQLRSADLPRHRVLRRLRVRILRRLPQREADHVREDRRTCGSAYSPVELRSHTTIKCRRPTPRSSRRRKRKKRARAGMIPPKSGANGRPQVVLWTCRKPCFRARLASSFTDAPSIRWLCGLPSYRSKNSGWRNCCRSPDRDRTAFARSRGRCRSTMRTIDSVFGVVRTSRPPGFRIRRTSSMKPSGWLRCSYTSEATTLSTDPVRNGRPASAVAAR